MLTTADTPSWCPYYSARAGARSSGIRPRNVQDRHRCFVCTWSGSWLTRPSIWIFHARDVKGGENPSLRTVFYRVLALLQHPVTPIFVFGKPQAIALF